VTVRELDGARREWPAVQAHADGFFEALLEGAEERFRYELAFTAHDGHRWAERDPFSFGTILGRSTCIYSPRDSTGSFTKSSARIRRRSTVRAERRFTYGPECPAGLGGRRLQPLGWRVHPMRKLLGCGVWEIFLPGVGEGTHYKFEVKQAHGGLVLKSDPFAFFSQHGRKPRRWSSTSIAIRGMTPNG